MTTTVDFYFDFGSPTAYLAYRRLQQLESSYDLAINYKPMLLGGVFKATGNTTPVAIPAKGKYMLEQDLPRYSERYKVPLNFNPHFPINTLPLMRAAMAAQQAGCFDAYVDAVFDAVWVDGANMGETAVIEDALSKAGLDGAALLAATADPALKGALVEATEEAVARGVFGAPTLFIGDDMYFGQDRLDLIEEKLDPR